jgi:hypothetical protein
MGRENFVFGKVGVKSFLEVRNRFGDDWVEGERREEGQLI